MTAAPDEAITVGELVETLITEYDDDQPVAVKCSGAYAFLAESGVQEKTIKDAVDAPHDKCAFLNGQSHP